MSPAAQQDGADGDKKRIRKTTSKEETHYFEGLYERVTQMAPRRRSTGTSSTRPSG